METVVQETAVQETMVQDAQRRREAEREAERQQARAYFVGVHANVLEALGDLEPALEEWRAAYTAARGVGLGPDDRSGSFVRKIAELTAQMTTHVSAYPRLRANVLADRERSARREDAYRRWVAEKERQAEQRAADEAAGAQVRAKRAQEEARLRDQWEESERPRPDAPYFED